VRIRPYLERLGSTPMLKYRSRHLDRLSSRAVGVQRIAGGLGCCHGAYAESLAARAKSSAQYCESRGVVDAAARTCLRLV